VNPNSGTESIGAYSKSLKDTVLPEQIAEKSAAAAALSGNF
jgi:hypothetical protein